MKKTFIPLFILLAGLTVFSVWSTKDRNLVPTPAEFSQQTTISETFPLGGAFNLTDQDGKLVSDTD